MKWIWPFSWYFRILELERQIIALRQSGLEMEKRLRSQSLIETSLAAMYASSLAAIASNYESYITGATIIKGKQL